MSEAEVRHPRPVKKYKDGMTKQSFKDQTDINKILKKAQRQGSISHLVKHGAQYGDFSDMPTLLEAENRLRRGREIFDELPSEVRKEFDNNAGKFFTYVNDPANSDRLRELLPAIAEPGRQIPAVRRSASTEANPAVASAEPAESPPAAPETPPATTPEVPPVPTT